MSPNLVKTKAEVNLGKRNQLDSRLSLRGEIDKYSWVDAGSKFSPSKSTVCNFFGHNGKLRPDSRKKEKPFWKLFLAYFETKSKNFREDS